MKHPPFYRTGLIALLLVSGVIAALTLIALAGGSGEPERRVSPTPAPVTFIPPTPLPPTITPTDPVVAHPVPDVTLTTLDGEPLRLRDLGGQVVFLNFWATWCEPCRDEMPALQAFQDQYGGESVRVIAVTNPTEGQTEDDIRAFVAEYGITFTIALTSDQAFYDQFGVAEIPTTFIIDPAGTVRVRHLGALDADDMASYLPFVAGAVSSTPTSPAGD
jgi:thiol-disulfide isomerase/thioredoxin